MRAESNFLNFVPAGFCSRARAQAPVDCSTLTVGIRAGSGDNLFIEFMPASGCSARRHAICSSGERIYGPRYDPRRRVSAARSGRTTARNALIILSHYLTDGRTDGRASERAERPAPSDSMRGDKFWRRGRKVPAPALAESIIHPARPAAARRGRSFQPAGRAAGQASARYSIKSHHHQSWPTADG